MSSHLVRCPRCGDIHQFRIRRAIAKLLVFVVVTALALMGLARWATW
jgi:hypothetical protein